MITKDKRTIALNNPTFEIVIKYSNPYRTFGTDFSSELMDKLSEELKNSAEKIIIDYLKEHYKGEEEKIIFLDNNPF